jgi:hypothetical protein
VTHDHDADAYVWNVPPTDMHRPPASWIDVAEQGAESLRQMIRGLPVLGAMPAAQDAARDHVGSLLSAIGTAVAHDTAGEPYPEADPTAAAAAEPTWLDIVHNLGNLVDQAVRTVKVAEVTDADPAVLAMLRDSLGKLGQAIVQAVDNSARTS